MSFRALCPVLCFWSFDLQLQILWPVLMGYQPGLRRDPLTCLCNKFRKIQQIKRPTWSNESFILDLSTFCKMQVRSLLRVQCLLHTSEDNKKGTTTLDCQVYCAVGLPSYCLKIPWRVYWVYKGYRTIDLESDPYLCFLGFLTTIWLPLLLVILPHAFRMVGPVVSWVLRQELQLSQRFDAFLMASISQSTLPLRARTWSFHFSWSPEARKTFGIIRIDTWEVYHACLRRF